MTDIEQRIADETAAAMRQHNLKQAHIRLGDIRVQMRNIEMLLEESDPGIADDIEHAVVNTIENLMWNIEARVREGGSK